MNCWLPHIGTENEIHTHEREAARTLGVWNRCRFLGKRNDVARLLSASDVFVMPSLHEGLSIACIEALAMGLPAVVSDVEGLRDLAKYIPICSKASLEENIFAEKIRETLSLSGKDLAERKVKSRKIIDEMFDIKCNVAKYVNLWK
jgi:glycosyltransferase involved in cell wall biosynthesis